MNLKYTGTAIGQYIPFVVKSTVVPSSGVFLSQEKSSEGSQGLRGPLEGLDGLEGSDILFKTSDLTWVAYNKYGGWNLYEGPQNTRENTTQALKGAVTDTDRKKDKSPFQHRATAVSYDRPWHNRLTFPEVSCSGFW